MPLNQLRAQLPEETQQWIRRTITKIRIYFMLWLAFLIFSAGIIWWVILLQPASEPIDKWIQRTGTLIVLLAGIGETLFIVKLRKLAKVRHWAQLSCEIYIERRYRSYLYFSISVTGLLVLFGTILGGYGDMLLKTLSESFGAETLLQVAANSALSRTP